MAQVVCLGELCIFYELQFCRSLNSCESSEGRQRETEFKAGEGCGGWREGGRVAGIRLGCVTSVLMIKLTSSGETLRKTAEHR